ncbi:putative ribonuclease H-like domain-containing protein, partial [Tanacetum coccineum]
MEMFNSGTQFKSGASRFNTGHGNVNSGSVHVNSGTQIKSGASRFNTGKQHVNSGSVHVNTGRVNRPVSNNTSPKPSQVNLKSPKKCFSKQRSPVNRPFSRNTAHKSNKYAVKGKMGTAVKTSAGCVWRKITPLSNTNSGPTPDSYVHDHPLKHMEHRGIFDSGCSGHMTGNRAHLEDYQELSKVGSVTFGGSKGSISGKGTIRLGNLVFDDVAFVKELGHFNLFSISQICDKKLNVLFTEKECFVVSSDFKMPDENQVLLKVPRQHNMYTFDMKNIDSSKGYTCLLAKASSGEAKLWHRRLGHLNFKNLNKLVKGNLVRGLPSKSFKNDHTCVACQKGKQHKASCKAKIERYVTHPLHTLHMDLFGPTSMRSINHASYCLVITDDCSRFCWVFFLAKKDETTDILKTFINFSKSGGWDQFGSNIATALICLSTGRVYNFSKLIFDGMMANLKNKKKFLMYPRFLQIILNIQTENKHPYLAVSLTKKIFGNMKRGFQGAPNTPISPPLPPPETEPPTDEHIYEEQSPVH